MPKPIIAKKNPLQPPDYDKVDVQAIKALARGEANADQQRLALNFIVNGLSCAFDQSFRPGQPDLTAFAEGKRFVGLQLDKLIRINPAIMDKEKTNG